MLQQEPCEGAETDSSAKFGKETTAGAHWRPKWVPYHGAGSAQALLRLTQAGLRHAQALFRHAHPRLRLKQ